MVLPVAILGALTAIKEFYGIAKPYFKKYGPYLLVLVIAISIYGLGRSHGKAAWKAKHDTLKVEMQDELAKAKEETAKAYGTAQHNFNEWEKCKTVVLDQNAAIEAQHQEYLADVARINANHARTLQQTNQDTARRIREAQAETDELREQMVFLTVAESCHASWMEVLK